jgi:hypothetical protein
MCITRRKLLYHFCAVFKNIECVMRLRQGTVWKNFTLYVIMYLTSCYKHFDFEELSRRSCLFFTTRKQESKNLVTSEGKEHE